MKLPTLGEVRKGIVALVGFATVIVAHNVLHGTAETAVETIVSVGSAILVYWVPNAPIQGTLPDHASMK